MRHPPLLWLLFGGLVLMVIVSYSRSAEVTRGSAAPAQLTSSSLLRNRTGDAESAEALVDVKRNSSGQHNTHGTPLFGAVQPAMPAQQENGSKPATRAASGSAAAGKVADNMVAREATAAAAQQLAVLRNETLAAQQRLQAAQNETDALQQRQLRAAMMYWHHARPVPCDCSRRTTRALFFAAVCSSHMRSSIAAQQHSGAAGCRSAEP